MSGTRAADVLRAVRLLHTLVWALLFGSALALPILAWRRQLAAAAVVIGVVAVEVVVVAASGGQCPLTRIAARYTTDRRANFDIFLPLWLARANRVLFSTIFGLGVALTLARWRGWWP